MERVPYPPAHAVAETVAQHFRRHMQRAGIPGEVPAPDATTPEQVRLQVDWVRVYSWAGAPAATKTTAPPSTKPERG